MHVHVPHKFWFLYVNLHQFFKDWVDFEFSQRLDLLFYFFKEVICKILIELATCRPFSSFNNIYQDCSDDSCSEETPPNLEEEKIKSVYQSCILLFLMRQSITQWNLFIDENGLFWPKVLSLFSHWNINSIFLFSFWDIKSIFLFSFLNINSIFLFYSWNINSIIFILFLKYRFYLSIFFLKYYSIFFFLLKY